MKETLRSYANSIESIADLKIQSHYVIITNDSINEKYQNSDIFDDICPIEKNYHMNFICDIGPVHYNKFITLLNFIEHGSMLDFIPEVLENHGLEDGDDFVYGTMITPEAYAHKGLLNEQPTWLLSRLACADIDGERIPDSIFVNHINLLSKNRKKQKLRRKSPQQMENLFNRYYFNKKYSKALNDLLLGTGIQMPDIKNSNSK